jgi:acyl carrier protein
MPQQKQLNTIIDVIAKTIQCDRQSIQPETRLEALGIDSLKAINIVYELEEEFDIEVPNELIAELTTVQDIETTITDLLANK